MNQAKIRVLIADDELLARKFIRRLLKQNDDVEIVGECRNGREAIAMIRAEKPDLVFLDVQMPEMDGFAVLEALGPEQLPEVIFTTAYESYALRAFELHALDYLLKPFDQVRFKAALRHAKERLDSRRPETECLQIGALLETIKARQDYLERIIIRADGRITFLNTRDIEWIEADDKYVYLHTAQGKRMVRQTLNATEAQLDPKRFVRVHRSAIVNVDRIKELQPLFNGEHSILMETGAKLTSSRNYRDRLFAILGKPL
ncbi:MAG TPA: LytTR family DNA-binding domain-containing protein [Chthoniobacterales bacterium]|nr:LytTR family DNA-binding domain-containing protein [Chthoniobacterales bacterium]